MQIDNSVALMQAQSSKINPNQRFSEDDKKLKEQTDAFEALLVKQYLDLALKEQNSMLPKSPGHEIYKSMQVDMYSKQSTGAFGFSEMLFNYLKENR
jgi:hypothetical protein